MKQFATFFTHGVRNGGDLRYQVHHAHTGAEILDCVDAFFARAASSSSAAG
jgi:tRNA-dihydrouridine synthase B